MQVEKTIEYDVSALNRRIASLHARERIQASYQEFGEDLILTTSFGPTAGIMLKLATYVYPDIRVVTIRHGYESQETLDLAERFTRDFGLNLHVYDAPKLLIPDENDPEFEAFKHKVKIEPFQKALAAERPKAWLSGVMREETEERKTFDFAMSRDGLIVIYPILDWTETDAEEFCLAYGLPSNGSYYDPTKGLSQTKECGLHLGKLGSSWTSSGL